MINILDYVSEITSFYDFNLANISYYHSIAVLLFGDKNNLLNLYSQFFFDDIFIVMFNLLKIIKF